MATQISAIETLARQRLVEATPNFWSSQEIVDIIAAGIRDLWRDIADLKQEHFLTIDDTVTLAANDDELTSLPTDIHKIYLIEPLDISINGSNRGLVFRPMDYNHTTFQAARSQTAVDPSNTIIYYSIIGQGAPTSSGPSIKIAPQVTAAVDISLSYVPTLGSFTAADEVPIPGEADNALVAWTVAFARAKEREDRSPDANWLAIYATEKEHLLQSLGLRQYQEPSFAEAVFEDLW
jgi:hypothetical protein